MDNDSKSTDKSNDSSSPPIVRITVVNTPSEEEVATWSSLNNNIKRNTREVKLHSERCGCPHGAT